jgi:hypothetical protein
MRNNPRTEKAFARSVWFTRGWTLQELLLPYNLVFLDRHFNQFGTKDGLRNEISTITGIPIASLTNQGALSCATAAQMFCWASERKTTRIEDRAYCLLGLFHINMPLLYGEGEEAFERLQKEILLQRRDETIFAWTASCDFTPHAFALAPSPECFRASGAIRGTKRAKLGARQLDRPQCNFTSKGLEFHIPMPIDWWSEKVNHSHLGNLHFAVVQLACWSFDPNKPGWVFIILAHIDDRWTRVPLPFLLLGPDRYGFHKASPAASGYRSVHIERLEAYFQQELNDSEHWEPLLDSMKEHLSSMALGLPDSFLENERVTMSRIEWDSYGALVESSNS